MDEQEKSIEVQLREAADGFCTALRMGDGIDDLALERLKTCIIEVGRKWRNESILPKTVVHDLVGLYSAVEVSSYLYKGEYSNRV